MDPGFVFEEITEEDLEDLAALVADAFTAYRAFAPAGWRPAPVAEQLDVLQRWMDTGELWGELALDAQTLVGHAACLPARSSLTVSAEPGLAHLGHLFVRPPYWGSCVASQLLARVTNTAVSRGFTAMRLFVPAGQARARRFYAREGFVALGSPFDPGTGLPVLECRRSLVA